MLRMATGIQRISLAVRGLVGKVERVIARAQVIDQVAVLELAAESLAIGQAEARARVIVPGVVPELAIVPAEALVLAIDLAEALVLIIVPAEVQVPVIALAEAREPETVQVEAVPVRNHLRARLAVPLRTKSVIALHHRGRVPLLAAVEDLAAVAEIMRAQAATEAVTAWEAAAVTAVVAAAVAVAIVVAAAADAADKGILNEGN